MINHFRKIHICFLQEIEVELIFHWEAHISIGKPFFQSSLISFAEVFRSRTTEYKEES